MLLGQIEEGFLGRPRSAGCEIGVTRFTRRPAMLQTPFLDLTEKHEGGLPSFLVLDRHSDKSDAQFVRRACVLREDVGTLPVGTSLDESGFELEIGRAHV